MCHAQSPGWHASARFGDAIPVTVHDLWQTYLVDTMVGVTARLVSVAMKDHDLDDHVTKGE